MGNQKELDTAGKLAERIVNAYGEALSAEAIGIAKPISSLKYSKEEIKSAIKTYIDSLVKADKLNKELIKVLSLGYASIDLFIEDKEAEKFSYVEKSKDDKDLPEELLISYQNFVQNAKKSMQNNVEEITAYIKSKY
ncbi:MAG: hypothetical protein ACNS60_18890 [Candidatus Cyclobacteriaceae bacterium M2_1C_046]